MPGDISTTMLESSLPAKPKGRSVMPHGGRFRAAYQKRYGKKATDTAGLGAPKPKPAGSPVVGATDTAPAPPRRLIGPPVRETKPKRSDLDY